MDCRGFSQYISRFIDGDLTAVELKRFEQHVGECPSCAKELSRMQAAVSAVRRMPRMDAPAQLGERTMTLISREANRPRVRFPMWQVAAAAAVVVVLVSAVSLGSLVLAPSRMASTMDESVSGAYGMVGDSKGYADVQTEDTAVRMAAPPAPFPSAPLATAPINVPDYERKVMRSAEMRILTSEFDEAYNRVSFLVDAEGGYMQQSNMWTSTVGGRKYRAANFLVRVPAEAYSRVLVEFGRMGDVVERSESGRDVTEEYYDVDARVRNAQRQESRLLEIMGRASTVDEILRVEQELARVRAEIEVMAGRLRYLDHVTSMATISLTIEEPRPDREPGSYDMSLWDRIIQTFLRTMQTLGRMLETGLLFLVAALPVLVALGLVYGGFRWWRRRR